VPRKGQYEVIFNSDDSQFGGSGYMDKKTYKTEKIHKHGRVYSIEIEIPPLATVYLKYDEEKNDEKI
jgi:1,4-alpha-glucan branching enzyme